MTVTTVSPDPRNESRVRFAIGDLLIGTATAATQIEGGRTDTNRAAWAAPPGRIAAGGADHVAISASAGVELWPRPADVALHEADLARWLDATTAAVWAAMAWRSSGSAEGSAPSETIASIMGAHHSDAGGATSSA